MSMRPCIQSEVPSKDQPKIDRRRAARRQEDRLRGQAHQEKARKLHSLLELGQIIGLDLQLNEMLLQIAQKATDWSYRWKASSVREELLPVPIVKPRRIV